MPYSFQTLSEEPLIQIGDKHVINIEVICSKVSLTTTRLGLKHHRTFKMVRILYRMLPFNLARALQKA